MNTLLIPAKDATYRDMADDHSLEGVCTNCENKIFYEDIAKEIKQSCLEEVICQDCWNNGNGYGYGDGYADGSGDGNGNGLGLGSANGNGYGSGDGNGNGYGDGEGYGDG